jgi:hypothetical protein
MIQTGPDAIPSGEVLSEALGRWLYDHGQFGFGGRSGLQRLPKRIAELETRHEGAKADLRRTLTMVAELTPAPVTAKTITTLPVAPLA